MAKFGTLLIRAAEETMLKSLETASRAPITCEEATNTVRRVISEIRQEVRTHPFADLNLILRRLDETDKLASTAGVEKILRDELDMEKDIIESSQRVQMQMSLFLF